MSNPFNPLEWLKTAQDWFSKAERSSGFRPYLIFLLIACGTSITLLALFRDVQEVRTVALAILAASFGVFLVLFGVKAFQDPEFCRSETHVHRMKKLELEYMGSETESLPGEVVEEQPAIEAPPQPLQIDGAVEAEKAGGR